MALAACLVAVWVEAFADVTVAWTTCGMSPPATGARLVNPVEGWERETAPGQA